MKQFAQKIRLELKQYTKQLQKLLVLVKNNFKKIYALIRFYYYLNNRYKLLVILESTKNIIDKYTLTRTLAKLIVFGTQAITLTLAGLVSFLIITKLHISEQQINIESLGFTIATIIGSAIAIIFSFSTFTLQNLSGFFSTTYLKNLITDILEKRLFWLLVILTLISLFLPYIPLSAKYKLTILIEVTYLSFYIIHKLYKRLRDKIIPEYSLQLIKSTTIKQLEKINSIFVSLSKAVNIKHITSLDYAYKNLPEWNKDILNNIRALHAISLKLLSKNEIHSFNEAWECIKDIYITHLKLRNGYFVKSINPEHVLYLSYSFDDEGFTKTILDLIRSIEDRLIQEQRTENIEFLYSQIYEPIIKEAIKIKYANDDIEKQHPLLGLILINYKDFMIKISNTNNENLIFNAIQSLQRVSTYIFIEHRSVFGLNWHSSIIDQITNSFSKTAIKNLNSILEQEITSLYFHLFNLAITNPKLTKINPNIIADNLSKKLQNYIKLFITINTTNKKKSSLTPLTMNSLFIKYFHKPIVRHINYLSNLKIKSKTKNSKKSLQEQISNLIYFTEYWTDLLLNLARDFRLENKAIGSSIILAVQKILQILHILYKNFPLPSHFKKQIQNIYTRNLATLSWYFTKQSQQNKNSDSFDPDLNDILSTLLEELTTHLDKNKKDHILNTEEAIEFIIRQYNTLIDNQLKTIQLDPYGYNYPRVIAKLAYLGLVLQHYNRKEEKQVIQTIEELIKQYIQEYKDSVKKQNISKYKLRLCEEIDSFKQKMNRFVAIQLRPEIATTKAWEKFIKKIKPCKRYQSKANQYPPLSMI